ncbi:hypothetical protein L0665_10200 [Methanogenium marinum]|uniref:Uncharacterized protein n=1 Tax=Methanogenium marinum TaxID=348610 RepID=A0A9Q4KV33_9EURY|nr:hypothetical protein [Methanogenium marinum]MDE4908978.1 hypothetical protein [Methanogenium marinum]
MRGTSLTKNGCISVLALLCICLLSWSVIPVSAVSSAVIGETVHLSGNGGGYDDMYLFLTGPNLAPGGVRPDSITTHVVSGDDASFIHVPVRSGVWEYDWNTGRTGGTLDPGTYLVWAVPQPLGRYDLGKTSYATINIILKNAAMTAEISGTTGNAGISGTEKMAEETATERSEETNPDPNEFSAGDAESLNNASDETNKSSTVSEDTMPAPTTAGSLSYSCFCAAGIAIVFLICVCRDEKR